MNDVEVGFVSVPDRWYDELSDWRFFLGMPSEVELLLAVNNHLFLLQGTAVAAAPELEDKTLSYRLDLLSVEVDLEYMSVNARNDGSLFPEN